MYIHIIYKYGLSKIFKNKLINTHSAFQNVKRNALYQTSTCSEQHECSLLDISLYISASYLV